MAVAHKFSEKARTSDVVILESVDFAGLMLSKPVLNGLKNSGFERPSPIQLKAIPLGRCGLDLIVQAKSGTGKTCVFSVVALEGIEAEAASTQVLVLAPTREIALQIWEVICSIGSAVSGLCCHTFIGGMPFHEDKKKLLKCHIAVGTPGRVQSLIEQGLLKTTSIRLFVLDEADKLLEENFQSQINWIYSALPDSKQMLALSATYPEYLAQHLTMYMRNPTFVRLNISDPTLLGIKQYYMTVASHPLPHTQFELKTEAVIRLLSSVAFNQCLIFSNLQTRAQNLRNELKAQGWPTTCIAGCLDQKDRITAITQLKAFTCRVLISTDLTSRGIDCDKVNLIINLDVPADHETYLHRIGRAGRFGSYGAGVTIVSEGQEMVNMHMIELRIGTHILPLPDPIPSDMVNRQLEVNLDDVVTTEQIITRSDHHDKQRSTVSHTNGHAEGHSLGIDNADSMKQEEEEDVSNAISGSCSVNGDHSTDSDEEARTHAEESQPSDYKEGPDTPRSHAEKSQPSESHSVCQSRSEVCSVPASDLTPELNETLDDRVGEPTSGEHTQAASGSLMLSQVKDLTEEDVGQSSCEKSQTAVAVHSQIHEELNHQTLEKTDTVFSAAPGSNVTVSWENKSVTVSETILENKHRRLCTDSVNVAEYSLEPSHDQLVPSSGKNTAFEMHVGGGGSHSSQNTDGGVGDEGGKRGSKARTTGAVWASLLIDQHNNMAQNPEFLHSRHHRRLKNLHESTQKEQVMSFENELAMYRAARAKLAAGPDNASNIQVQGARLEVMTAAHRCISQAKRRCRKGDSLKAEKAGRAYDPVQNGDGLDGLSSEDGDPCVKTSPTLVSAPISKSQHSSREVCASGPGTDPPHTHTCPTQSSTPHRHTHTVDAERQVTQLARYEYNSPTGALQENPTEFLYPPKISMSLDGGNKGRATGLSYTSALEDYKQHVGTGEMLPALTAEDLVQRTFSPAHSVSDHQPHQLLGFLRYFQARLESRKTAGISASGVKVGDGSNTPTSGNGAGETEDGASTSKQGDDTDVPNIPRQGEDGEGGGGVDLNSGSTFVKAGPMTNSESALISEDKGGNKHSAVPKKRSRRPGRFHSLAVCGPATLHMFQFSQSGEFADNTSEQEESTEQDRSPQVSNPQDSSSPVSSLQAHSTGPCFAISHDTGAHGREEIRQGEEVCESTNEKAGSRHREIRQVEKVCESTNEKAGSRHTVSSNHRDHVGQIVSSSFAGKRVGFGEARPRTVTQETGKQEGAKPARSSLGTGAIPKQSSAGSSDMSNRKGHPAKVKLQSEHANISSLRKCAPPKFPYAASSCLPTAGKNTVGKGATSKQVHCPHAAVPPVASSAKKFQSRLAGTTPVGKTQLSNGSRRTEGSDTEDSSSTSSSTSSVKGVHVDDGEDGGVEGWMCFQNQYAVDAGVKGTCRAKASAPHRWGKGHGEKQRALFWEESERKGQGRKVKDAHRETEDHTTGAVDHSWFPPTTNTCNHNSQPYYDPTYTHQSYPSFSVHPSFSRLNEVSHPNQGYPQQAASLYYHQTSHPGLGHPYLSQQSSDSAWQQAGVGSSSYSSGGQNNIPSYPAHCHSTRYPYPLLHPAYADIYQQWHQAAATCQAPGTHPWDNYQQNARAPSSSTWHNCRQGGGVVANCGWHNYQQQGSSQPANCAPVWSSQAQAARAHSMHTYITSMARFYARVYSHAT